MRHATIVILLTTTLAGAAPAEPTAVPERASGLSVSDAVAAYLRDPVGGSSALLAATQGQPSEALGPMITMLVCDARMRRGHLDLAWSLASDLRRHAPEPGTVALADVILALVLIMRGNLGEAIVHLDAATAANPGLHGDVDPAIGMLAAIRREPDGMARFTRSIGQSGADPAWHEMAPLLDAYARYWNREAADAGAAFTAFAVAHPNSRFTDDALYAAARAKLRAGLVDEARAELEDLAGDGPRPRRVSRRLLALDGHAIVADGVERDRTRSVRSLSRRMTDLLDGDGVELARAALARLRRRDDDAPETAPGPNQPETGSDPPTARSGEPTSPTAPGPPPPRGAEAAAAGSVSPTHWLMWTALGLVVLIAIVLWRAASRRPGRS
jgi:hypothetical protein